MTTKPAARELERAEKRNAGFDGLIWNLDSDKIGFGEALCHFRIRIGQNGWIKSKFDRFWMDTFWGPYIRRASPAFKLFV